VDFTQHITTISSTWLSTRNGNKERTCGLRRCQRRDVTSTASCAPRELGKAHTLQVRMSSTLAMSLDRLLMSGPLESTANVTEDEQLLDALLTEYGALSQTKRPVLMTLLTNTFLIAASTTSSLKLQLTSRGGRSQPSRDGTDAMESSRFAKFFALRVQSRIVGLCPLSSSI